ncbi:MAG: beta-lactamase family protein [Acidobacteria bacterium]|nr:beta-lactamase family protein [Acidobacteriota bacterium]
MTSISNRRRVASVAALAAVLLALPSRAVLDARPGRDLAVAPPESVGVSSDRLKRLDTGMKGLVDQGRLAGVVTLMARKGKVVHFAAHGKKDLRQPEPIAKDSIFRIYSMTKPITGVAMLMLYEEGKWRLDDPVSRFIPEFAKLVVYTGENPDGTPKTEPARRSMTMRELMTHTAGLGYGLVGAHPVDKLFLKANVLDSSEPLATMIGKMAGLPLLAQPGTRWSYSAAVDVQGYLVEKLSGLSFAQFLETRLFAPLGMKDTAFHVPAAKLPRLARMHREDDAGTLVASDREGDPTVVPKAAFGGHGLFSTASDYARFAQMLLDGGEFGGVRVLAPRTVEMFRTNHVLAEPLKTMRQGQGWGLGPQVILDAAASGEPYSDGSFHWWGIGGTWFWVDPVKDLVFVGMIQYQGRGLAAATQIHGYARNLAYQAVME